LKEKKKFGEENTPQKPRTAKMKNENRKEKEEKVRKT